MADDALATIRLDSVLSALNHSLMRNGATGMGTSLDPYNQVEVGYGRLLNEQQLRALYRGSWFIRRVVDLLPQDMTKAGVEVMLHDGSNARIVNKAMQLYHDGGQRQNPYERRLGCNEARRLALTYARWFGMGYIVLRVNGGENPGKPLTKVKSFEGVSVLDRYSLRPAIGTIDVHNPEYYQVSRHDAPGGFGGELPVMQRIHASRVLVYKGAMIHPYDIQLEGDGGHDSVVQQVYEAFARHFMAKDAISKGLDSYSLFKVAISGLSTLLQSPNGTQTLTEYLNTVAQQMSLHRIIVQDTEASKSEFQERSFAGVAENFKFFVDDLIASTGYPHYKIYGSVGKAGLADSGGAESRAWAETVNAYQSMELADNDRTLFHAIFEALGRVPKQWEVTYPSIYSSTPEEEANLAKVQADTLTALTREGVITTRQAYQSLATGQPLENVLKPLDEADVLTPVEEEAAQGPSAEDELAALLGGDAPAAAEDASVEATPVEPEAVGDTPAEDVPEEVAVDEPLPDAVDAPLEEPLEEDEIATEVESEVVPDDEPEPLSAEEEMAALLAEDDDEIPAVDDGEEDELGFSEDFTLEVDDIPDDETVESLAQLEQVTDSVDDALSYLLGWRTDAPSKGGKGKRGQRRERPDCSKGRSCGMSCVDRDKSCEPDLSPMAEAAAKAVARRGRTGGNNADPFDPRVNPLNIPDAPKASGPKKVLSVWMKPIERGAANGLQAIEKRQATIDNLYKGLMAGRFNPLFGDEPERITNGKMGALNALSDAKNPKIGLFASTNSEGKFTGFMSTKEGRNSIEISSLGTDGTQPGSGRAMFNQLIWMAASKGKGLDVSPVPDAVEFYRKMGMTGDMGSMEMSADAVRRRAIQLRKEGQL
jgi:phage-related protein (TIGR01555 family)